jgi:tetratricopeptide (TPR) repeat protein
VRDPLPVSDHDEKDARMFSLDALRRSPFSRRLGALVLTCGLLAVPACKKGEGSKNPGGGASKEDVARAVEDAKQKAKAATLIDIANADLAEGRYVSASKRAEEALAEDPNDADAHAVLGAARWRAGDYTGSTEAYEKALEADPKNFGAALGLARNLQAGGKHARAIELSDGLIQEDKDQLDPYLTKLQSQYATLDADGAVKTLDEIFQRMPAEDPQLPLIQAQAAFMRPLAGKGKLCEIKGSEGKSDAGIDHNVGAKFTGAVVAGEFQRVLMLENTEEAVIDADLAKTLKLPEVGKYKALGQENEEPIVLIPEIAFGEMKMTNVPAVVRSLAMYDDLMPERPGVLLGRQALGNFGSMTFDFPGRTLTLTKDAPKAPPAEAAEVPFILVSMFVLHAPSIPIRLAGSEHVFWVYLGGNYKAGVAVTQKNYFKSGHLPREVDPPDDPNAGLKMVFVDGVEVGGQKISGTGGLVLLNTPPDQTLGLILDNTRYELGGYVNLALLERWSVTYALGEGKVFIKS